MVFNQSIVATSKNTPIFEIPVNKTRVGKINLNSKIKSISHVGLMVIDIGEIVSVPRQSSYINSSSLYVSVIPGDKDADLS
jgi:hypothetical protein